MTEAFQPPADGLADLAPPEVQRLAARMAQDAFTLIFRLTLEGDDAALQAAVAGMQERAGNWARAAPGAARDRASPSTRASPPAPSSPAPSLS